MRQFLISAAVVVASLVLGLVAAEVLAQGYANHVLHKAKRFQPDDRLGWVTIPNLDLERQNSDGEIYHLQTDARSYRGASDFPSSGGARKMLVVGDSFAFGEGTNLEDRFDTVLAEHVDNVAVVNVGVPGFGTDQQVLRARDQIDAIGEGDLVLLLIYGNDFYDVARTQHSGRSKPWVELSDGTLVRHVTDISFVEWLRDKSFLFSVISTRIARDPLFEERFPQSLDIIEALLAEFSAEVNSRGAEMWLVLHGLEVKEFPLPFQRDEILARLCDKGDKCFDLDSVINAPGYFLNDGHWSAEGNHAVGAYMAEQF